MSILASIDYFSFAFENETPHDIFPSMFPYLSTKVREHVQEILGEESYRVSEWREVAAIAPLRFARQHKESACYVAWSPSLPYGVVQFAGGGVDYLESNGKLGAVLQAWHERASRVDIAVDIETDICPKDFAETRSNDRFQSFSHWNSVQGQTSYVGSMKSERYARVYRYNEPHPRAGLLRVEHVFRRLYAKQLAARLLSVKPEALMRACGEIYGWQHPLWQPELVCDQDSAEIRLTPKERHRSQTLRWLEDVCIPAAVRLHLEGEIPDLWVWMAEQVNLHMERIADKLGLLSNTSEG